MTHSKLTLEPIDSAESRKCNLSFHLRSIAGRRTTGGEVRGKEGVFVLALDDEDGREVLRNFADNVATPLGLVVSTVVASAASALSSSDARSSYEGRKALLIGPFSEHGGRLPSLSTLTPAMISALTDSISGTHNPYLYRPLSAPLSLQRYSRVYLNPAAHKQVAHNVHKVAAPIGAFSYNAVSFLMGAYQSEHANIPTNILVYTIAPKTPGAEIRSITDPEELQVYRKFVSSEGNGSIPNWVT